MRHSRRTQFGVISLNQLVDQSRFLCACVLSRVGSSTHIARQLPSLGGCSFGLGEGLMGRASLLIETGTPFPRGLLRPQLHGRFCLRFSLIARLFSARRSFGSYVFVVG